MFLFPAIGLAETLTTLFLILVPALIFTIRALITNNLAFADWWARTFKMGAWKKKTTGIENRSAWGVGGLPAPEKELAEYYSKFARATDEYTFKNAYEWLKLSGQSGTTPLSALRWVFLFILTFVEAIGTGMLLATFISTTVTGNMVAPIGFAIATGLALALLLLTHLAGSEAAFGNAIKINIGTSVSSEKFNIRKISPGDDYRIDDGIEQNRRFANRALDGDHHRASVSARIWAFTLLTVVVMGIFAIRVYENRQQYDQNVQEPPSASAACDATSGSTNSSDPFSNMNSGSNNSIPGFAPGTASPPSVNCNATKVKDSAAKDGLQSGEMAADIAAVLLAIFYVMVQFVGFNFAKRHSFFGEGSKAYEITQGYISYDELRRDRLEPVYNRGNHALQILRNHLIKRVNKYRDNPSDVDIQQYIHRSIYREAAHMPVSEKKIMKGVEALKSAIDYRKSLSVYEPGLAEYPASLEGYSGYMLAERHNNLIDSDSRRKVAPPPVAAPAAPVTQLVTPTFISAAPVVQARPDSLNPDLSNYDILDIEAAEEMLKADGVLERKQILDTLSEGSVEKKALLQEIYKKLKEGKNA